MEANLTVAATPAHRIQQFRETVFAEMSALAASSGAINLGQGFPDFPGPAFVKEAAKRAIDADRNQYAHPHGVLTLRTEIAADWTRDKGIEVDPVSEVSVTSGATEAIFDSILGLVNPGDEVVTFEPFYDSYPAAVALAGGRMRAVRLNDPSWDFDAESLEAAITDHTRVILLNTPHNPTGKVFTRAELEIVARVAHDRDLIVVSDEVYDRILFDEAVHVPMATLPGMWERTLTINSAGKTFSLTGWKVGYAVGPSQLIEPLRAVHQFVTFATSTPFQEAMAESLAVARVNGYYDELRAAYHERRDVLARGVEQAGLPVLPTSGSYFIMASFADLPFDDDVACSRWLTTDIGVATIPPSAFYLQPETAPKLVRLCFAKHVRTLQEAVSRLSAISARLHSEPES